MLVGWDNIGVSNRLEIRKLDVNQTYTYFLLFLQYIEERFQSKILVVLLITVAFIRIVSMLYPALDWEERDATCPSKLA